MCRFGEGLISESLPCKALSTSVHGVAVDDEQNVAMGEPSIIYTYKISLGEKARRIGTGHNVHRLENTMLCELSC